MKASEHKIDVKVQEEGGWVGEKYGTPIPQWGDLCLKVKGVGNKAWEKLYGRMLDAVPRSKKIGRLDPTEQHRLIAICTREAGLLDWENFEDDDGPIAFSKEAAAKYLENPEHREFRDAVLWAMDTVARVKASEIEDDVKNSSKLSAGTTSGELN
jgi:hypothetical protein